MIVEVLDKHSGAILFKKDKDTQEIEDKMKSLEEQNQELLKRLALLEKAINK